jgi:hypothetical protein
MPPDQLKIYGQMENTCGLASLLMILQPESRGIENYFVRWWEGVKNVTKAAEAPQVEFNWERVLNYILLKALKHPRLRAYAEEKLGELGLEYFILFEDRIQQNLRRICVREGIKGMFLRNAFESAGVVCDPLLQEHLNLMKKEYELKILYHFFGGKFQHHYESVLPTGAISFTQEEVKDSTSKEFQQKIHILEQAIQAKSPILLGLSDHWLVVKTLKSFIDDSQETSRVPRHNYFVYALDPLVKLEKTYPFQRINENFLFYIFEQDNAELHVGLQLLDEVLMEDFPKDAGIYQRFVANEIGVEEPLKEQLTEMFGTWPLPKEEPVDAEEAIGRATNVYLLEAEDVEKEKPLPTEEEMIQRLRAAIKKGFSDYLKV